MKKLFFVLALISCLFSQQESRGQFIINSYSFAAAYDTDADAYFTAASITDATQKNAWNTFVVAAKANGYWTKLYAIYPFLGGTSTTTSYNAKNTAQYQITWSGTVTHNSNGVTGSSTSLGNTGFSTATLSDTSGSIGAYLRGNPANNYSIPIGGANCILFVDPNLVDPNGAYFYPVYGGVNFVYYTSSLTRLVIVNKNATYLELHRNGSLFDSQTGTSTLTTGNIAVLGHPDYSANYIDGSMGLAFIATDLTSTDVTNFTNDVNTLMTSLGRNV